MGWNIWNILIVTKTRIKKNHEDTYPRCIRWICILTHYTFSKCKMLIWMQTWWDQEQMAHGQNIRPIWQCHSLLNFNISIFTIRGNLGPPLRLNLMISPNPSQPKEVELLVLWLICLNKWSEARSNSDYIGMLGLDMYQAGWAHKALNSTCARMDLGLF